MRENVQCFFGIEHSALQGGSPAVYTFPSIYRFTFPIKANKVIALVLVGHCGQRESIVFLKISNDWFYILML